MKVKSFSVAAIQVPSALIAFLKASSLSTTDAEVTASVVLLVLPALLVLPGVVVAVGVTLALLLVEFPHPTNSTIANTAATLAIFLICITSLSNCTDILRA
ncbi:hypothetical protein D3C71_1751730 [compost metagenome]